MISRRSFVGAAAGIGFGCLTTREVRASGRTPYGGSLTFHAPWPLRAIDPHRIDDGAAAFFGAALFDTLYSHDGAVGIGPCLAEADPEPDGLALRVRLRTGVVFGSGTAFDARAAAAAIARARASGASAWLVDIPVPHVEDGALLFAMHDAARLKEALASPLVAIVPTHFSPQRPEGTGPFRGTIEDGSLSLTRNTLAAGGPAFLDGIVVHPAADLSVSLRAFESGADDIGWLGSFLHEPRQGARSFDAGAVGWAILRTGAEAGALDVPGMAQALLDAVPHAALAPLGVGAPWPPGTGRWTGGPSDLLVRDDSPWLEEVARTLAVALSSPSHELSARAVPPSEIGRRRASRSFSLILDVARPAAPSSLGAIVGLATADDPRSAGARLRAPPKSEMSARTITRTMRIGVVGDMRLQGGRAGDVLLPVSTRRPGIDWGGAFRRSPAPHEGGA